MENLEGKTAKCKNLPGYVSIEFASVDEVSSVDMAYSQDGNVAGLVEFVQGGCFGKIDAKEVYLSDNASNGVHDIEVSCKFRGTPDQVDGRLNELTFGRYLVRLKDRSGKRWLVGCKGTPLHFDYAHIGESEASGVHEYQLRFFGVQDIPLLVASE